MIKSNIFAAVTAAVLFTSNLAFAADIPSEMLPEGADSESAAIVQSLIGSILDDVISGEGYGTASARANNAIRDAVNSDMASGYGYGILSAISQNAIRYCRDMYLRPDYYADVEENVKSLISDIITEVQNGSDYNASLDKAYTRIYQAIESSYNPASDRAGDFCYWDIPAMDWATFAIARKLLLAAVPAI